MALSAGQMARGKTCRVARIDLMELDVSRALTRKALACRGGRDGTNGARPGTSEARTREAEGCRDAVPSRDRRWDVTRPAVMRTGRVRVVAGVAAWVDAMCRVTRSEGSTAGLGSQPG
jgi:hypothetical protein